ncbi:hypothetical protein HYT24_00615 [Candidatus Pacearchaeota archaeon]|nr:hypothetical protein [Candidatus Pacearchaeota archaeon]
MEIEIPQFLVYVVGYSALAVPAVGGLMKGWRSLQRYAESSYNSLTEVDINRLNQDELKKLWSEATAVGLIYDFGLPLRNQREIRENISKLTRNINSKLERVTS